MVKNQIVNALWDALRPKKFVVASVVTVSLVLSPLQPVITTMAYENPEEPETTVESTIEEADQEMPEETVVVESVETEETAQTDFSDYADEEPVIVEETDIIESSETEPTLAAEDAGETTSDIPTETTVVEPSEETTVETTIEETEPEEEAVESNITFTSSAEDYYSLVADMPNCYKLVVNTTDDLSDLGADYGVYYGGTYILGFDSYDDLSSAIDSVSAAGYEYAEDGTLGLCGNFGSLVSFANINPNASVKVAVIDTGSNLANERYSVIGSDVADHQGHGTAMCDFVLSETSNAYIISIKAIGDNGKGDMADVYAAVQLAEDLGVDYILMAISIKDNGEYDAFRSLIEGTKATVVAAAGNNGTDAALYLPAGIDGVITVGASYRATGELKDFSNYGACVNYYVDADSTSEASARAVGKLISGQDMDTFAFDTDASMLYMDGSADYFVPCWTIQNTKTIVAIDSAHMGGYTKDEFLARAADWGYSYSYDTHDWNTTTYAGGCIEYAIKSWQYARGSSGTTFSNTIDGHYFNFDNQTGCTSFMTGAGFSASSSIGITGLYHGQDMDQCIASGNGFYQYITQNATPGDLILFSNGSATWVHAAIYAGTGTEDGRNAIKVYEVGGTGQRARTRYISASDFHIWGENADKAFSTAVLLTASPTEVNVTVKKTSTNTAIVAGSSCYNMAGTTYGLYKTSDDSLVHTFTIDSNGNTTAYKLQSSDGISLYIKEITAGKGYKLDTVKHTVDFSTAVNGLITVNVKDEPMADPITWTVRKEDPYNWNLATDNSLAGAVFKIDYYDRTDIRTEGDISTLNGISPKVSVNLTSSQVTASKAGIISINITTLSNADTSGYFASFGSSLRALPIGTYRITEITAPSGYKVADANKPLVYYIYDNNGAPEFNHIGSTTIYNAASASEIIMSEFPQTGLFAPTKSASDPTKLITGLHSLAGTQYGIYYKNNDKLACVVTFDDNGKLSDVDYAAGITPPTGFFKQTIELPIGEYYAKEITAGRWFLLDNATHDFTITSGNTTNLDLKDKEVPVPKLHTTATDADTGNHNLSYKEKVTINDVVAYEGLVVGEEYTVIGTLYDASTGKIYEDYEGNTYSQTVKFKPIAANGEVTVIFTDVLIPYGKAKIVVFEELYENQNNVLITTHADLNDKGQTVERPTLQTTATDADTGIHTLSYKEKVTINDVVAYEGLEVGEEYTVTGTLYDVSTGKIYEDYEGNTYTQSVTFTPVTANGEVTVIFTDVLIPYGKAKIVVFEDLYSSKNNILVATHADLNDKGQTVERSELHTTATDADTGNHTLSYKEKVTINDVVAYEGLEVGAEYTVTGTLYDADTGIEYKDPEGNTYSQSVTFTATTSDGTVDVVFTDVLVPFEKTTLVVFENLYESTTKVLIATHADLTDENQTVRRPTAGTTATILNAKEVWLGTTEVQKLTISDTIAYTGLEVGTTYRAEATLYKSDGTRLMVDGQPIKSILEFTPTTSDGKVVVDITFSTEGLAEGDKIVVFEKIYDAKAGVLVAVHEDLTDEGQTVTIHFRPMTGSIVPSYSVAGSVIAVVATAIAGVWFFISRRKKYSES